MKIPGLSFSLKRAVGISGLKSKIAQKVGIPQPNRVWSARLVEQ